MLEMTSDAFTEYCKSFRKDQLIQISRHFAEEVLIYKRQSAYEVQLNNELHVSNRELHRVHTDTMRTTERLQAELREKIHLLDAKVQSLEQERILIERSEAGLRVAVNQQIRQIEDLKSELAALGEEIRTDDSTPVEYFLPKPLLEKGKATLQQMEEHLTDPVTFELFTDPITLSSGHTFSRQTVYQVERNARGRGFRCPVSNRWVDLDERYIAVTPKSITVAKMTELYSAMKAEWDRMESEMGRE